MSRSAIPSHIKMRRSPMEHPRHQYPQETRALQEIARSCGLTEKIKWGKPCFMFEDRNVVLIQRFNKYIALIFFKGALLKDPQDLLLRISENMEVPRQLRFTHLEEINALAATIAAYVKEAIDLERSGAKTKAPIAKHHPVPSELQVRLDTDPVFRAAFASLTPGRQKG